MILGGHSYSSTHKLPMNLQNKPVSSERELKTRSEDIDTEDISRLQRLSGAGRRTVI